MVRETNLDRCFSFAFHGLMLLLVLASCKRQSSSETIGSNAFTAEVAFSDTLHNFGTFPKDCSVRRHVFTFTNRGEHPAVIVSVEPSCRCVTVNYTHEVVRAGEQGKVEVIFDGTKADAGHFEKSVRIRMNTPRTYTLRIKGCME